jgi:hypothetical protein
MFGQEFYNQCITRQDIVNWGLMILYVILCSMITCFLVLVFVGYKQIKSQGKQPKPRAAIGKVMTKDEAEETIAKKITKVTRKNKADSM